MAQNLELKARLRDFDRAVDAACTLGAVDSGVLHQRDTYYRVADGRLKLRVISQTDQPRRAELIGYQRPDETAGRTSTYDLVPTPDPDGLDRALTNALGVLVVVAKARTLWLQPGLRIHLDRVAGLGDFLEFELILGPDQSPVAAASRLADLRAAFQIADADLIAGSYSDLLLAR